MNELIFPLIYFTLFIAGSGVRGYYARQYRREDVGKSRRTRTDRLVMSLPIVGMLVLPLIHVLTPWLDVLNYSPPWWTGIIGVAVYVCGIWLLWRSHADLGKNWSPSLEVQKEHTLVTRGVYRYIRHPMYSAHFLWGLGMVFLFPNWLVGFGLILTTLPLYFVRVPQEERMMLDEFGDEYREYMGRTGRVVPGVSL